ncbi:RagB/SusD family nutrient uptake outer membrane protein [Carboxylicivirga taeanensis]|uniref:RagB/SusD family nutrient uptake outer membrane protein n=1 Tax=Carboxylicivirga taeanensis TaxID=1416875 RepID=UPI003F6DB223
MRNTKYYILFVLIAFVGLQACNDNINLEPEGIITEENFFTSPADFDKALVAAYARWNSSGRYHWMETTTDNAITTHGWNLGYDLGYGIASSFSYFPDNKWSQCYVSIQRTNTIIQNIDNYDWESNGKEDERARILGEARTMRAFYYYELVGLFGRPMMILETPSTVEQAESVKQAANPKEVFDFILKEMEEAIPGLPEYPANKSLIGQAAARAFRARFAASAAGYLNDNEYYKIVRDETAEILKMQYSLADNYEDLFTIGNEKLSETILLRMYNVEFKNWWGENYPQSVWGYSVVVPTKSLVDAYEYIAPQVEYRPYENKDPRFKASIYAPGMEFRWGYYNTIPNNVQNGMFHPDRDYADLNDRSVVEGDVFGEGGGGEWNKTPTGFNTKKYFSEPDTWDTYNNLVLVRLAEVMILRAEALTVLGENESEARSLIQTIRARAGNTNSIDDVVADRYNGSFLELIRNEQRVEMAMEGMRPFDIRRWGIFEEVTKEPVQGIEYRQFVDKDDNLLPEPVHVVKQVIDADARKIVSENYFWWPIPQKEMDQNGDRIEQNPNW